MKTKVLLILAAIAILAGLWYFKDSDKVYYATTDMTFPEFFAGELGKTAETLKAEGVDVVTSATHTKAGRFAANTISADTTAITGVKAVSVAMTHKVYKKLSEKQKARFTFVNDTIFANYKQLNADGSFSAYNEAPVPLTTDANISAGFGSNWGNYGIHLGINQEDINSAAIQGGILTDSDGQKYPLLPLYNTWLNASSLAFCIQEFTEPHGCKPAFAHTAALAGKTITNITYLMKSEPSLSVDCNLFVKPISKAQIAIDLTPKPGRNPRVKLSFTDVPEDANYTIAAIKKGQGRHSQALNPEEYSYVDGVLTILQKVTKDDIYVISFDSDKYASIGTSIKF